MTDRIDTWADAQIRAWEYLTPDWPEGELGVLTIAPWGWESPRSWGVTVTNDVYDGIWLLIAKADGNVEEPPWDEALEVRSRMGRVGDWAKAPA